MPLDPQQFTANTITDGYLSRPEDADQYATVPLTDGLVDFAIINPDVATASGMFSLPIRLVHGRHFGSGGGYGIAHILYHHAPAIALLNYHSVQELC